jgi:hypothetical protein
MPFNLRTKIGLNFDGLFRAISWKGGLFSSSIVLLQLYYLVIQADIIFGIGQS